MKLPDNDVQRVEQVKYLFQIEWLQLIRQLTAPDNKKQRLMHNLRNELHP